MHNIKKILALPAISTCLLLSCCGTEGETQESAPKQTPQLETLAVENSNQSQTRAIPTQKVHAVTLAGINLEVTVGGTLVPNADIDVQLIQTSGNRATAIRLWVGDASGVGSVKTRVHSHGASYHATAQVPATLPTNCALWIEVQNSAGQRESISIHF